jgi:membrane fusion protein (multidrug efflux system)
MIANMPQAGRWSCRTPAFTTILLVFLTVALASACQSSATQPAAPVQAAQPAPTSVRTVTATTGDLEAYEEFTGEILADFIVDVAPLDSGRLVALTVDEGQSVVAGQTIGVLDNELQELRRAELTAQRQSARQAVATAEAAREEVTRDVERRRPLVERGALSSAEFERLQDRLLVLEANVAAAEAAAGELDALLRTASRELERRTLVSPASGIVVTRHVDSGAMVTPQTPVVTVVATDSLQLVARIPERRLAQIALGTRAWVYLDAGPGQRLSAEVIRIGDTVDRASRTVEVRLLVQPEHVGLRHGMFARGQLVVSERSNSVLLPVSALLGAPPSEGSGEPPEGTNSVWIVSSDGVIERRPVTVLLEAALQAAVAGVHAGESVIVRPQRSLVAGITVLPVPEGGATN